MHLVKSLNYKTALVVLLLSLSSTLTFADNKVKSTTARNEAIVIKFFNKIFNKRASVERTANKYLTEDYIQHNPYVATGREGFITAISGWLPYVPNQVSEIKRVISAGDLVMLHVHYYDPTSESLGSAVIDIFRVNSEGKISEHWDVSQEIPEWMAHDNGMF
jgi:predicted SnoaL-like aldol condensation-catalyzing enzyme